MVVKSPTAIESKNEVSIESDEFKVQKIISPRKSSLDEMAKNIIEIEELTGKRVTRATSQHCKSQTLNVDGFMKELELGKLYCTKETTKTKESVKRNSRKLKNTQTPDKDETQSSATNKVASPQNDIITSHEIKKLQQKKSIQESDRKLAQPTLKVAHDLETINAEGARNKSQKISTIVEQDPLDFTADMETIESITSEKPSMRKGRSCIKITPRRSPNSRLLSFDTKFKVQKPTPAQTQTQTSEEFINTPNIEQTTIVSEQIPQKKKLLEDMYAESDNLTVKKAKVVKNSLTSSSGNNKINTILTDTVKIASEAAHLTSDNLRERKSKTSTVKSIESVESVESTVLLTGDSVKEISTVVAKFVESNELTQKTLPLSQKHKPSSQTTTAIATATVSEIRSFRPRRKTIALETEVDHQQVPDNVTVSATETATILTMTMTNTNSPSEIHSASPKANVADMRTSSPSISPMEKVRINVDVANPLSSQIANILATSGSGQHAANVNLTFNKSATLKRKKSIEDVIPSFIIERPTMGNMQPSPLIMVEKDAVAHVQSMCPQVQITRKEKLIDRDVKQLKELKKPHHLTQVQLQKLQHAKKDVEVDEATTNAIFDINNMPMILGTDQLFQNDVHYVISSATSGAVIVTPPTVGIVETVTGGRNITAHSITDGPQILQQQIIQPARQSPPPPVQVAATALSMPLHSQRQHISSQQQQQQLALQQPQLPTNNTHTQLGVDSRGNKYVIIKTPPTDLVLQKSLTVMHHTQSQQQSQHITTAQAAKASGMGAYSIGTGVTLRPIADPKINTKPQQTQAQVQAQPQTQMKTMAKSPAAAATGGRKQAGNIITLPHSVTMKTQQHKNIDDLIGDVVTCAKSTTQPQQQFKVAGKTSSSGKASRRHSANARKAQVNVQAQAHPQLQSQKLMQCQFKSQHQPMPVQQRRLTAATFERHDNTNGGTNRRLSCTDTTVSPAKIQRTAIISGGEFRSEEVALAEQQLLRLQEQRRKVQSAPTTPLTTVPPPLYPLHNRKPRNTPQQHHDNGKKRLSIELDTIQQQQKQQHQQIEVLHQQSSIGLLQQNVAPSPAQPTSLAQVPGQLLTTEVSATQLTQIATPPLVQIIAPPLSDVTNSTLNACVMTPLTQMAAPPLVQVTGPLLAQSAAPPLIQVTASPLVQVATSLPHQQEQAVDSSPTISEEQLAQLEPFSLEDMKNVVAVRAGPIPCYPDIFVLYKLVENTVTMFQQGPYYLNHDLNQLVQVPPEALEGVELIVDHPSPEDIVNLLQQAQGTQLEALETMETNSPTPFICLGSPEDGDTAASNIITETNMDEQMRSSEIVIDDLNADTQVPMDSDSENSPGNYILLTIGDQQVGCKVDELAQLLANSDDPHIITINGTPFVLSDDIINALRIHKEEQQRQHNSQMSDATAMVAEAHQLPEESGAADIIAVALAGTELYGNEVLQIETSQALQLMGADGNIVFQPQLLPPAHLTPPITAHTSETNALLNQTPIMSTLEKPSTGVPVCHGPTLDDSLAVIGLTTQASAVPTSLELPITVTNPAIAPKVTMATSHTDMAQFQPPNSLSAAISNETRIFNDPGS